MSGEPMEHPARIAYFSMEIGLGDDLPTYAGGLGVLAGDFVRGAADLRLPVVAVTLLHRRGYFFQRLSGSGEQSEEPAVWEPAHHLAPTGVRVSVQAEGRTVLVTAWKREVAGRGGGRVPVLFLDADEPENAESDRPLTHQLYQGDARWRLMQELVLGVGGVRVLRALGLREIDRFHMNEGHAALLTLELLREESEARGRPPTDAAVIDAVRRRCVFTTHTPIEAGHDKFPLDLVGRTVEPRLIQPFCSAPEHLRQVCTGQTLNMTFLGFNLSRYVNGVARRHGEVSRRLFAPVAIDSITNGVHPPTWVCPPMAELFDSALPGWREDHCLLRGALGIDGAALHDAHARAKAALVHEVNHLANAGVEQGVFTIGCARRATAYKRLDLLLADPDRLGGLAQAAGGLQVIFAGKAHPYDHAGKEVIRSIVGTIARLGPHVRAAYLPNYDMGLCALLVGGCDLWLNTPQPPLEASGTSGMKAALNGVPQLSTLDGWWLEGWIEGVTGWAIGDPALASAAPEAVDPKAPVDPAQRQRDAASLYDTLERQVLPAFGDRARWAGLMRQAIALNGSFFNTQRMLQEYVLKAYFD